MLDIIEHKCMANIKESVDELKNGLQVEDDLVNHFFEVDHFTDECMKFKHKIQSVMAPYKTVYEQMQKNAKLFNKSSSSPSAIYSVSLDQPENFQPRTLMSLQERVSQMFLCY